MEVLEKVINELKDCHVEACVTTQESENLKIDNNHFENIDSGNRTKLEIRVTKGRRSAYAWTNNLDAWNSCAQRAKKLMMASSELKTEPLLSKAKGLSKSFVNKSLINTDITILKSKATELINASKELGVNVSDGMINKSIIKGAFLNSNLTSYKQEQSSVELQLEFAVGNSSAWDTKTSQGLNIDFAKIGRENAKLCLDSVKAKKFKPGLFDVVFDYSAINNLLSILTPSLMANNIIEHNSFFEGKQGQKVISQALTIKDVGVMPDGINNQLMDHEGSIIKDKELFSKGVLNSFMNDLYTANRMNVEPTGNSGGLLKRGLISNNYLFITPGKASNEELLDNCIYVNNLMGSHTANLISGDFALNALNSFEYKNNKKKPIRDVMISGNIFELFKKAILVGKESRFDSSLKTPMIKFEKTQVVG